MTMQTTDKTANDSALKLHGFFNSSAAYRVRIALALKGLPWEHASVNLRAGVQNKPEYRELNATGLVPTLEHDGTRYGQSLAIIDHLDRLQPEPRLIPLDDEARQRALEIALQVACDIHPLNNLRVLKYLVGPLALSDAQKNAWIHHWLAEGFRSLESMLPDRDGWCVGSTPTVADCCLVPQVANGDRVQFDFEPYPRVRRVVAYCRQHPAFKAAAPTAQPDYVAP
jgi:maleylacetoacetate isomerase